MLLETARVQFSVVKCAITAVSRQAFHDDAAPTIVTTPLKQTTVSEGYRRCSRRDKFRARMCIVLPLQALFVRIGKWRCFRKLQSYTTFRAILVDVETAKLRHHIVHCSVEASFARHLLGFTSLCLCLPGGPASPLIPHIVSHTVIDTSLLGC